VLADDQQRLLVTTHLVNAHDVGMCQLRCGTGFPEKQLGLGFHRRDSVASARTSIGL